jgi:hypothetical protein
MNSALNNCRRTEAARVRIRIRRRLGLDQCLNDPKPQFRQLKYFHEGPEEKTISKGHLESAGYLVIINVSSGL